MATEKTNAMRVLDKKMIPYNVFTYDSQDGRIDGISVAQKIGKDPQLVYKTLVTQGKSGNVYVFVIPVESELDWLYSWRVFTDRDDKTLSDLYRFQCLSI